jgi:hypothetical protein
MKQKYFAYRHKQILNLAPLIRICFGVYTGLALLALMDYKSKVTIICSIL